MHAVNSITGSIVSPTKVMEPFSKQNKSISIHPWLLPQKNVKKVINLSGVIDVKSDIEFDNSTYVKIMPIHQGSLMKRGKSAELSIRHITWKTLEIMPVGESINTTATAMTRCGTVKGIWKIK